ARGGIASDQDAVPSRRTGASGPVSSLFLSPCATRSEWRAAHVYVFDTLLRGIELIQESKNGRAESNDATVASDDRHDH
ncbi:TPA: hypothetical protein ACU967_008031, partial [Burkholderia contaminans]